MIKIMELKDYFDFNEEEKEKFVQLFNTISEEDHYYTKSNISRYNILREQLTINSILQTIMDTVNNKNDNVKVNPFNRVEIGTVVDNIEDLNKELLEKGIDTDGLDLSRLTLDEVRMILYNSVGIKTKSLADLYDYEMNECNRITNFNYADLIVQGINPDSVLHPEEKSFIDKDFLVKYGLLDKYILEGQIFGTEILSKKQKIK